MDGKLISSVSIVGEFSVYFNIFLFHSSVVGIPFCTLHFFLGSESVFSLTTASLDFVEMDHRDFDFANIQFCITHPKRRKRRMSAS